MHFMYFPLQHPIRRFKSTTACFFPFLLSACRINIGRSKSNDALAPKLCRVFLRWILTTFRELSEEVGDVRFFCLPLVFPNGLTGMGSNHYLYHALESVRQYTPTFSFFPPAVTCVCLIDYSLVLSLSWSLLDHLVHACSAVSPADAAVTGLWHHPTSKFLLGLAFNLQADKRTDSHMHVYWPKYMNGKFD